MAKLLIQISFSLLLSSGAAFAQPQAAPLAFEVANVKPSAPLDMAAMRAGKAHIGTRIDNSLVDIGTASLFRLICTAYGVRPYQVTGPDWLKTTMYDIQAKIPDGVSADNVPEMLQTLLVDRFGLKIRHDRKEQPVYALVVAPGGPRMKESAPEPGPAMPATPPVDAPKPLEMSIPTMEGEVKLTRTAQGAAIEMPGGEIKGKIRMSANGGPGQSPLHLESSGMTMKTFAELLSVGVVVRPVVDLTGLTGGYDVGVDISPDDALNVARATVSFGVGGGGDGGNAGAVPGGAAPDPAGSSIFSSIEKLGLKLEARKLPLDFLVVEHMEKTPTEN